MDPVTPKDTQLKQLTKFIQGDIYHCTICNAKYEENTNLARVLFCGDCMCEECIRTSISIEKDTAQVKCKICGKVHTFKMAGPHVVANDNFVRLATNGRLP